MTADWIKGLCMQFDNVSEHPHFFKKAYKVKNKVFATLDFDKLKVSLKLSEIDQSVFCNFSPEKIYPANGAWGRQGWTIFEFYDLKSEMIEDAITLSYNNVQPKK
ncbi:MmcQ/YjbR family DNA-binding protein [Pedobacter rhodius]|uniref:MmcQ/YjbR family DNA-binding protein n=1 Tax=Pedobacter rhodius TaxID=3004098 RepID=A0ABT4KVA0_9SPHI|nr:MmcQ/YjbR family DNA-binding protein [Pedobacter sp. SJ11]MCZ4222860.1 MmcQ/YjbR family DNA-binding protein [Pedobacter sp. SJ11]